MVKDINDSEHEQSENEIENNNKDNNNLSKEDNNENFLKEDSNENFSKEGNNDNLLKEEVSEQNLETSYSHYKTFLSADGVSKVVKPNKELVKYDEQLYQVEDNDIMVPDEQKMYEKLLDRKSDMHKKSVLKLFIGGGLFTFLWFVFFIVGSYLIYVGAIGNPSTANVVVMLCMVVAGVFAPVIFLWVVLTNALVKRFVHNGVNDLKGLINSMSQPDIKSGRLVQTMHKQSQILSELMESNIEKFNILSEQMNGRIDMFDSCVKRIEEQAEQAQEQIEKQQLNFDRSAELTIEKNREFEQILKNQAEYLDKSSENIGYQIEQANQSFIQQAQSIEDSSANVISAVEKINDIFDKTLYWNEELTNINEKIINSTHNNETILTEKVQNLSRLEEEFIQKSKQQIETVDQYEAALGQIKESTSLNISSLVDEVKENTNMLTEQIKDVFSQTKQLSAEHIDELDIIKQKNEQHIKDNKDLLITMQNDIGEFAKFNVDTTLEKVKDVITVSKEEVTSDLTNLVDEFVGKVEIIDSIVDEGIIKSKNHLEKINQSFSSNIDKLNEDVTFAVKKIDDNIKEIFVNNMKDVRINIVEASTQFFYDLEKQLGSTNEVIENISSNLELSKEKFEGYKDIFQNNLLELDQFIVKYNDNLKSIEGDSHVYKEKYKNVIDDIVSQYDGLIQNLYSKFNDSMQQAENQAKEFLSQSGTQFIKHFMNNFTSLEKDAQEKYQQLLVNLNSMNGSDILELNSFIANLGENLLNYKAELNGYLELIENAGEKISLQGKNTFKEMQEYSENALAFSKEYASEYNNALSAKNEELLAQLTAKNNEIIGQLGEQNDKLILHIYDKNQEVVEQGKYTFDNMLQQVENATMLSKEHLREYNDLIRDNSEAIVASGRGVLDSLENHIDNLNDKTQKHLVEYENMLNGYNDKFLFNSKNSFESLVEYGSNILSHAEEYTKEQHDKFKESFKTVLQYEIQQVQDMLEKASNSHSVTLEQIEKYSGKINENIITQNEGINEYTLKLDSLLANNVGELNNIVEHNIKDIIVKGEKSIENFVLNLRDNIESSVSEVEKLINYCADNLNNSHSNIKSQTDNNIIVLENYNNVLKQAYEKIGTTASEISLATEQDIVRLFDKVEQRTKIILDKSQLSSSELPAIMEKLEESMESIVGKSLQAKYNLAEHQEEVVENIFKMKQQLDYANQVVEKSHSLIDSGKSVVAEYHNQLLADLKIQENTLESLTSSLNSQNQRSINEMNNRVVGTKNLITDLEKQTDSLVSRIGSSYKVLDEQLKLIDDSLARHNSHSNTLSNNVGAIDKALKQSSNENLDVVKEMMDTLIIHQETLQKNTSSLTGNSRELLENFEKIDTIGTKINSSVSSLTMGLKEQTSEIEEISEILQTKLFNNVLGVTESARELTNISNVLENNRNTLDKYLSRLQEISSIGSKGLANVVEQLTHCEKTVKNSIQNSESNIFELISTINDSRMLLENTMSSSESTMQKLNTNFDKFSNTIQEKSLNTVEIFSKFNVEFNEHSVMFSRLQSDLDGILNLLDDNGGKFIDRVEKAIEGAKHLRKQSNDELAQIIGYIEKSRNEIGEYVNGSKGDITHLGEIIEKVVANLKEVGITSTMALHNVRGDFERFLIDLDDLSSSSQQNIGGLTKQLVESKDTVIVVGEEASKILEDIGSKLQIQHQNYQTIIEDTSSHILNLMQTISRELRDIKEDSFGANKILEDLNNSISNNKEHLLDISRLNKEELGAMISEFSELRDNILDLNSSITQDTGNKYENIQSMVTTLRLEMERLSSELGRASEYIDNVSDRRINDMKNIGQTVVRVSSEINTSLNDVSKGVIENINTLSNKVVESSSLLSAESNSIFNLQKVVNESSSNMAEVTRALDAQFEQLKDSSLSTQDLIRKLSEESSKARTEHFSKYNNFIIENLQLLGVDIARELNIIMSEKEWTRFINGDSGIFIRKIVDSIGNKKLASIYQLYKDSNQFRQYCEQYIKSFEDLITQVNKNSNNGMLSKILYNDVIGRVYLLLVTALNNN